MSNKELKTFQILLDGLTEALLNMADSEKAQEIRARVNNKITALIEKEEN